MFGFSKRNKLSQDEANRQIESGENIVVIDVRAPHEFTNGHIKNAINVPMQDILQKIESVVADKDQKIFVNCLSGGRSKASVDMITAKGYTNVYDIGGISTWKYGIHQ